ncbi:MAG: hypothetical protein K5695_09590 [Oscillospiraceae bacterium]|nr:hypothetical protein [Oscillospiraceae bacterium]
MRIELNAGGLSSGTSVATMQDDLGSLVKRSNSMLSAFQLLRQYTYQINGGVGCLQDALNGIEERIQIDDSRAFNIAQTETKVKAFVQLVHTTDSKVADLVKQNHDAFYMVNAWAKPVVAMDAVQLWYSRAMDVLNAAEKIGARQAEQREKVDLDEMSDEELQAYYEEMLLIANDPNRSPEDEARLNDFLDYLSDVDVKSLKYADLADPRMFPNNKVQRDCLKVKYYVALYEPLHENDTKAMNTFFSNYGDGVPESDHWRDEEILAIKYLAYRSPQPQHDLLMKYMPQIKVADFNTVSETGSAASYYDPSDRMIHLNRELFLTHVSGDYHVIFHEIGHNVDDLMYDGGTDETVYNWRYSETTDGAYAERLDQALERDVSKRIWKAIDDYNEDDALFKIDGPGKQQIYDVMVGKSRYEDLNLRLKFAYDLINRNVRSDINRCTASDAYESQTRGNIYQGPHHSAQYWEDEEMDNMEVFSAWFASGICNPEDYERARQLLPETYQTMDEMAEKHLGRSYTNGKWKY